MGPNTAGLRDVER